MKDKKKNENAFNGNGMYSKIQTVQNFNDQL